jgi:hypothetical protein
MFKTNKIELAQVIKISGKNYSKGKKGELT